MKTGKRQITMRANIISSLLFLVCLCFCRADQSDELYNKYLSTIGGNNYPEHADVSWITPDVRQLLIKKAYAASRESDPDVNFGSQMALIELGDPAAIKSYVAKYRLGDVS